jgi:hypothetical protein
VELLQVGLTGGPVRADIANGLLAAPDSGVIGVDVAARSLDGRSWTVVQLLLDDDHPGFDRELLDGPLVAEVRAPDGSVHVREPFDHDEFRRQLRYERDSGESLTRGVLVTTNGQLPPPWIRLAFLPADIATTADTTLVVVRTTVAALRAGADDAYQRGEITDDEHRAMLVTIEQRHPEA